MNLENKLLDKLSRVKPPIDIENIVLQLWIRILDWHIDDSKNWLVIKNNNFYTIFINNKLNKINRRLAIGHELHHIISWDFGSSENTENKADNYSRDLLISDFNLIKYSKNKNISELSSFFLVNKSDIFYKINKLWINK